MGTNLGKLLGSVQQIVNSFGVDKVTSSFEYKSDRLRLRLEFQDIAIKSGRLDGFAISAGLVYLEDLDLSLAPKEMIAKANIRVERIVFRLAAGLLNRFLTCDKTSNALRNLPVNISNLNVAMAGERLTLRGEVHKMLTFPFAIDLKPEAKGNNLRVVFENFWAAEMVPLPDFLRNLLMSVINKKIAGKQSLQGFLAIDGDVITLNPWKKIPYDLHAEIKRFSIEGHFLVLELGATSVAKNAKAHRTNPALAANNSAASAKGSEAGANGSDAGANGKKAAKAVVDTDAKPSAAKSTRVKANIPAPTVAPNLPEINDEPEVLPFI